VILRATYCFFPAPHSKPIRQQWLLINAHMFLLMSIQHLIDAKVVLLILFPRAIFTRYWYELFKKLPLKSETPTTSIDWQRYNLLYEDNFKNNNRVALDKNMLMEHQLTSLSNLFRCKLFHQHHQSYRSHWSCHVKSILNQPSRDQGQ